MIRFRGLSYYVEKHRIARPKEKRNSEFRSV